MNLEMFESNSLNYIFLVHNTWHYVTNVSFECKNKENKTYMYFVFLCMGLIQTNKYMWVMQVERQFSLCSKCII